MENNNNYYNCLNEYQIGCTPEVKDISNSLFSQDSNIETYNYGTPEFDLNHIGINNEENIINEKTKIKLFDINEEDYNEKSNKNQIKEEKKEKKENQIIYKNENENPFSKSLLMKSLKFQSKKSLRKSNYKINFNKLRNTLLNPKSVNSLLKNNNEDIEILRKTLMINYDFNRMRRISITNFHKSSNKKINIDHVKNNQNFIKYDNIFLEDEFYLRAPGSFPDEEEENYLLKINFIEDNNYFEDDNTSNNKYIDQSLLRHTKTISYNSKNEKNIKSKFLMNGITFDKIEEEEDNKEENKINNKNYINESLNNSIKDIYNDEKEIPGKNICYDENAKNNRNNSYEEGSFNKNLVDFENESKISFISINLFIKKIAINNFRINYPNLYKAFLQQYNIFISAPLFIEKIMQAFEFFFNKDNIISNELINLLNIVISENYEKVKDDFFLFEKVKNFYTYLKAFFYTESKSAIEKEVDNIYYILFEPDSDEDFINYSRRFVLERKKSNSIFIKSKIIYNNIFSNIKNDKDDKNNKKLSKKTSINYNYFYIFMHDSTEIAQYLTCISYQLMRNINQKELLNKNFASKDKLIRAPNVMKMIDRFNKLVLFIIEDIFSYDSKKIRCQCIEKWVDVGLKLQELHNYNDLVMINTCFVNLTLNKLKNTFKKLSNKYKNIIKEMNLFCSSQQSYLNIRKLIFNLKGIPYIPYLGVLLKEIISIEEMKYIIDGNNINFGKIVKLYNVLNRFNEFKKLKFSFEKSKELDILINLKPKTEDELEEMVSQIEPKLKIFALKGNKKRLTNTDIFYYEKNQ